MKIENGKIFIFGKVQFRTGSAEIDQNSEPLLDQIAQGLNANPQVKHVQIEGYTDNVGDPRVNQRLSEERAASVKDALERRHVDGDRLVTRGFGETHPIAPNDIARRPPEEPPRRVRHHGGQMRIAPLALVLAAVGTAAAAPVDVSRPTARTSRCAAAACAMTDGYRDEPGFVDDRDIVGDRDRRPRRCARPTRPTCICGSGSTTIRRRIRCRGAASWGIELDLDGDPTTYELLMLVDGIAGEHAVELFTNHTVTLPNDPNDPADQPAVATYPFANNARSVAAPSRTPAATPTSSSTSRCRGPTSSRPGSITRTATRLWVGVVDVAPTA